ncbi:aspartic peptidase domain-containing protein [Lenzites betulinus]|nr:aspartic peptidase domain-containing protein [Lenzites betulinus]
MRAFELATVLSVITSFSLPSAARSSFSDFRPSPSKQATSGNTYPVSVTRDPDSTGFGFSHADNDEYTATIIVNGVPYQVILDTGSSDTWIDPLSLNTTEPPELFHLGVNSTTQYVDGSVSTGPIVLANVTFGAYTIQNQAITVAYNGSSNPSLYNGLIGLGGELKSQIYGLLMNSSYAENATPILYNLFKHETDLPNYTAFLMSRSEVGITDGGVLTVSEILPDMLDVLQAPKFVSPINSQWTTVMDGVYVNGVFVNGHSNFSDIYQAHGIPVPDGDTIATFDTGTSYIQGPPFYTHLIYQNVPGAQLIGPGSELANPGQVMYSTPCDAKINITWSFGGNLYPMHPVDTIDAVSLPDGSLVCVGTIMGGQNPNEDWLLGASFLRNAYQLYDYGSVDELGSNGYIQLLSLTDPDQAWAEADALNSARVSAFESFYTATLTTLPGTVSATATPISGMSVASPITTDAYSVVTSAITYVTGGGPLSVQADILTMTSFDSATAAATAFGQVDLAAAAPGTLNGGDGFSTIERNSWIILGLLAGVFVLLLVVIVLLVRASKANRGYRAVPPAGWAPTAGTGKAYGSYSEPYTE